MNPSASVVRHDLSVTNRQRQLAIAAAILIVLLFAAMVRHVLPQSGVQPTRAASGHLLHAPWLLLHLLSVGPALPFGIAVMLRRKGGRAHRLFGRSWVVLMLVAAGSGLALGKGWSPIHLLSVLTLAATPISVWAAIRGDIPAHRRGMTILFASLVAAGFFTLLPNRMLGGWLLGAG